MKTVSSGSKLLQIAEGAEAGARRERRVSKSHVTDAGQPSVSFYGNLPLDGLAALTLRRNPGSPPGSAVRRSFRFLTKCCSPALAISHPKLRLVSEVTWYTGSSTSSSKIVYSRVRDGRVKAEDIKEKT